MTNLPQTREVKEIRDYRVYIADIDIFITDKRNRILQSRFINPTTYSYSDYDLQYVHQGMLRPAEIVYSPGTAVTPVDNSYFYRREQARAEGEDVSNWTQFPPHKRQHQPEEWFQNYNHACPIIKAVKLLSLDDYRGTIRHFLALKTAEESRLEQEIKKIREGRDKKLDTLVDYLKNIVETA